MLSKRYIIGILTSAIFGATVYHFFPKDLHVSLLSRDLNISKNLHISPTFIGGSVGFILFLLTDELSKNNLGFLPKEVKTGEIKKEKKNRV
jgi:hypothetical protein